MFTYSSVQELDEYLSKHSKKNLIFDVDWTLLTYRVNWDILVNDIHAKLKQIDPTMTPANPDDLSWPLYNDFIKKYGQKVRFLLQEYYGEFEPTRLTGIDYNEDLLNYLRNSHAKYDYFIWSSNQPEIIERAFSKKLPRLFFKKIVSAPDVTYFKPDPEGFSKLLFDPVTQKVDDWLMVGDSSNDLNAAQNAGIDFFRIAFCTLPGAKLT